jgi:transposase
MITQTTKRCPLCGEPNTGINGYFFYVDGVWSCLGCGNEFVATEEEKEEQERG